MIRLDAYEFLEKFKNAEAKSISTDSGNREIVFYEWDEETETTTTYYGPDPDRLDFLMYMEFLSELYKTGNFKDFIYSYVFSKLG